jgi:CRP-like cAMP-binding protein
VREQVLHAGGAGATLAEVPVFDGAGYFASAFAMEPCRIMMIPRAAVLDTCRRHPALASRSARLFHWLGEVSTDDGSS